MAREVLPEEIEMLDELVARAEAAAKIIATYDQERVDRLCQAVTAAVYPLKVWGMLADEAVDETGLGDKVTKRNKRNKLKLILRDCLRQPSVGIIEENKEKGIVKYAKPVGVIGTLVPTTNPCLTPAGQVIYAIGCGLMVTLIRQYGNYPEGVTYAILLMNILTPHIDRFTLAKPFGFIKPKKEEPKDA